MLKTIKLPSEKYPAKCFQPIENYYSFKQRLIVPKNLVKDFLKELHNSLLALIVESEITKPYL